MTAKEYTCYYAKVRDQDLPMAIAVLADMFTSSLIDPEEFESERGVILEELAMADDDPSDVVSERFFEAVFGAHPLGRPIGGSPTSIGAVGRDAVWEHYRTNYRCRGQAGRASPPGFRSVRRAGAGECAHDRRASDRAGEPAARGTGACGIR